MNKAEHTYDSPGATDQPGALWYGTVRGSNGDYHEVAVIKEEPEYANSPLCSGSTFFGWKRPEDVTRDAE